MKFPLLKLFIIITTLFSFNCDKGIAPETGTTEAGFSGTIYFIGSWPDSITRTHLVVFKDPLNTLEDFSILNLKYVGLEIPTGTTVYTYSSLDSAFLPAEGYIPAGEYSYIAVAQQKKDTLSLDRKDWFVSGLYYANGDSSKPGKIIIPQNQLLKNVNIYCDFNNPPPQPPGG